MQLNPQGGPKAWGPSPNNQRRTSALPNTSTMSKFAALQMEFESALTSLQSSRTRVDTVTPAPTPSVTDENNNTPPPVHESPVLKKPVAMGGPVPNSVLAVIGTGKENESAKRKVATSPAVGEDVKPLKQTKVLAASSAPAPALQQTSPVVQSSPEAGGPSDPKTASVSRPSAETTFAAPTVAPAHSSTSNSTGASKPAGGVGPKCGFCNRGQFEVSLLFLPVSSPVCSFVSAVYRTTVSPSLSLFLTRATHTCTTTADV